MNTATSMRVSLLAGLALAASPLLAAPGDTTLTLGNGRGAAPLQVESFSWGMTKSGSRTCPAASDTGRWMAPELNSGASGRSSSSSSSSSSAAPPDAVCVSAIVSPRDVQTGMASGRRGWDGCVKGARFDSVSLVHRDLAYRMSGVSIVECTARGAVLSFDSVSSAPVPRAAMTVSGSN